MTERQLLDLLEDAVRFSLSLETPKPVTDALADLDAWRRLKSKKFKQQAEFKSRQIDAFQENQSSSAEKKSVG